MCSRIRDLMESCFHSKIVRVLVMFVLTIVSAIVEIIFGIRAHSQSLIADGLYSFAEGICIIGVFLILRYSDETRGQCQTNTFGTQRMELLFGLVQEVFLLSISLGIIVDAINHLVTPSHIPDAIYMIYVGLLGVLSGLIGIVLFRGYHHDHDITRDISEKRKQDLINITKTAHLLAIERRKSADIHIELSTENETEPLSEITQTDNHQDNNLNEKQTDNEDSKVHNEQILKSPSEKVVHHSSLQAFTYQNVAIKESKIYATLHALCLHSFVVVIESLIVVASGLLIKYVPHHDSVTGAEINTWLKYIDPSLTFLLVIIIAIHAIPVIISISTILIENVPKGIDTQQIMEEIIEKIPTIKHIHSFHVWRATTQDIYAMFHVVVEDDVSVSTCSNEYIRKIEEIFKTSCIRYFTIQFEYIERETSAHDQCLYQLARNRRGHTYFDKK